MSIPTRIPISRPDLGPAERSNVMNCFDNNWISQGNFVAEAEFKLCEITGRKFAICTSSGTAALEVVIQALAPLFRKRDTSNIPRETKIAVPTLTFAAVFNAVERAFCQTEFMGVDAETWQAPISEYWRVLKQADAFIAAPCYGGLGPMDQIEELTNNANMWLIEDCAESFTGSLGNRKAGSFGIASVTSFYVNKVATASEGGAIFTDEESVATACREIVNHGIVKGTYTRQRIGTNARMTDLSAGILVAQLERLPEMLNRRHAIMQEYRRVATGWQLPTRPTIGEMPAPWLFCGIPKNKKAVEAMASELNVETRPIFPCGHAPNVLSTIFDFGDKRGQPLKNAESISRNGIVLPLFSGMTDEEIERVTKVIRSA